MAKTAIEAVAADAVVLAVLRDARDGCHGCSETRCVGTFILEATEDYDRSEYGPGGRLEAALDLCDSLIDQARALRKRIQTLKAKA